MSYGKKQIYNQALKSVAAADMEGCGHKLFFYPVPPASAITIDRLWCHFRFQFYTDIVTDVADRVIEEIGIASEFPLFGNEPGRLKTIPINQAADGDGLIDIKVDLTTLLDPSRTAYYDYFEDFDTDDMTMVYIKLPDTLELTGYVGMIELWKTDSLYTTREIR